MAIPNPPGHVFSGPRRLLHVSRSLWGPATSPLLSSFTPSPSSQYRARSVRAQTTASRRRSLDRIKSSKSTAVRDFSLEGLNRLTYTQVEAKLVQVWGFCPAFPSSRINSTFLHIFINGAGTFCRLAFLQVLERGVCFPACLCASRCSFRPNVT